MRSNTERINCLYSLNHEYGPISTKFKQRLGSLIPFKKKYWTKVYHIFFQCVDILCSFHLTKYFLEMGFNVTCDGVMIIFLNIQGKYFFLI